MAYAPTLPVMAAASTCAWYWKPYVSPHFGNYAGYSLPGCLSPKDVIPFKQQIGHNPVAYPAAVDRDS